MKIKFLFNVFQVHLPLAPPAIPRFQQYHKYSPGVASHSSSGTPNNPPPRSRACNWTKRETEVLLQLYFNDPGLFSGSSQYRRMEDYQQLADALNERCNRHPFRNLRTATQVNFRLSNMRQIYKKLKKRPVEEQQKWRYINLFDRFYNQ